MLLLIKRKEPLPLRAQRARKQHFSSFWASAPCCHNLAPDGANNSSSSSSSSFDFKLLVSSFVFVLLLSASVFCLLLLSVQSFS